MRRTNRFSGLRGYGVIHMSTKYAPATPLTKAGTMVLERQRRANAYPRLVELAHRIAAHFSDTDAPLGIDATTLLRELGEL